MGGIATIRARALPLDLVNVDTDRIIPARFLKQRRGPRYRDYLFHDDRFGRDGRPLTGFVLDDAAYRGARILVADANFGIGSAREGAVWALQAFGFATVIASGFGDSFRANCIKNGLLPVVLSPTAVLDLRSLVRADPQVYLTIDLPLQQVAAQDRSWRFSLEAFENRLLAEGGGEIALTLTYRHRIDAFERAYKPFSIAINPTHRRD